MDDSEAVPGRELPPAGWAPDPRLPGRDRWWDGRNWTDVTRPRTAAIERRPGVDWKWTLRLSAVTIACFFAIIAAVSFSVELLSNDDDTYHPTVAMPNSEPAASLTDWITAVCQVDTFANGESNRYMVNTTGGTGLCKADTNNEPLIYIGVYNSLTAVRQDMQYFGTYTMHTDFLGEMTVFALRQNVPSSTKVLGPLRAFDFDIEVQ